MIQSHELWIAAKEKQESKQNYEL